MKWEGGRGEEQMSQNGTGRFFFSVPKKAMEIIPLLPKVVPFYTLMFAHNTHSRTLRQPHAPSIVTGGQNMTVMVF